MVYFVVSAYVDNMLVEIQHCDTGFNFKVDSLLYNTYFIIGNTSNTDIMKVSGEEFIRLHNSHKVLGVRYNKGENIYNIFYLTFWKAILLCNIKYIGTSFTRLEAFNGKYHDDYFMDCILKLSGNSDFYIKALDPSRQSYIYLHIVNLLMINFSYLLCALVSSSIKWE